MSRGGGGGGRGGRGGRGGGGRSQPLVNMGAITWSDVSGLGDKGGHLYPKNKDVPRPAPATQQEIRRADLQIKFLDAMKKTAYWPSPTTISLGGSAATVAAGSTRKTKEVPKFTDRYRPEEQDPPSLKKVKMQKEVFPGEIWRMYMEGETKREGARARAKERKIALANFNWDEHDDANATGGAADGADGKEPQSPGYDDGEEALGTYEEEEDDDYAQNYFDNGEDGGDDELGDDDGGGGGGDQYD